MIFTSNNEGIYYNYMRNTKGVSILNTVEENKKQYNQQKYNCAKMARKFTRLWVTLRLNTKRKLLR